MRQLASLFVATLGGVVLLYLVIDFADRAHGYRGAAWGKAVAMLYANKAAVVTYQLAPAALIIAAALFVTQLARRSELVALYSVGISPLRLAAPVAAFAALLGAALFLLGEKVVVGADARAEEIQVKRFNTWGDWATYHAGKSWVRGREGRYFHLGAPGDGGFDDVTVLEIAEPFRLSRRIQARRIEPAGPGRWRLLDAVETRYAAAGAPEISERRAAVLTEAFPETPADFALRGGRPRQLSWGILREQTARRRLLGQPVREYELALAERAAQPVQAVPAALASLGLALRRSGSRRQRRTLAGAVALGIGLTMSLWAVSVVAHAASLSGGLAAWAAGSFAPALATLLALATLRPWRTA